VKRGLVTGLVAVFLLPGVGNGRAAPGTIGLTAASQAAAEPTLLSVVLPDLDGMHPSVQEQLREAYASLMAVQSVGGVARLDQASSPGRVERSDAYGQLGILLMAGQYLDVAERCLQNARRLVPNDFRWPYYLGHLLLRNGDLPGAVESFGRALEIRPDDLAALVWLGYVHIDLGQPDTADSFLTRARVLSPDTAAVLFHLGRAATANRDYLSAVEHLERALELTPAATVIHYSLAMAYRGLGEMDKARYYLARDGGRVGTGVTVTLPDPLMAAVSTALRSPQAYRDLGIQAGARGHWPEAATQFQKGVELAPEDPVLRFNLAVSLNRMGDARAALDQLEEAVRLNPQMASALSMMGALFERSGRDQEAIDRYTRAVIQDPGRAEVHLRLADALRRTDQLDASLSSYQRVLALDPDEGDARFGEAMALVRLTRYVEARERLRVAMDLHPEEPAFPNALARLLAASPDALVRDGEQALELAQALAEEHRTTAVAETTAMAFAELGRFTEAVEWQRLAMSVAAEAGQTEAAQQMATNLSFYQRREPCRTPWRDDAPEHRPGPIVVPGLLAPAAPF